jgi:hypothetical protein
MGRRSSTDLWQVDTRRQRLGIDGEEEQHGPVEMRETESDDSICMRREKGNTTR